jgi:hypothetical protein
MPNTYTELLRTTVGTATSSVTLSLTGISGYTDLVIVCNGTASANTGLYAQFNGDTANNYSLTVVEGSGSAAVSERQSNVGYARFVWNSLWNTSTPGLAIINLQNYSNTTTFKTMLWRSSTASNYVEAGVNTWRSTAAITSIVITGSSANIAVGSTFSLYGIANADQGAAKATGGMITEDSQYYYHTFVASGTFTPKQSLTCEVLAIGGAGGGASAWNNAFAGGGNSGTVTYNGSVSTTATGYSIAVGAGGAGGPDSNGNTGSTGASSTFNTTTVVGAGGTGGAHNNSVLPNGGSGAGVAATNSNGANGTLTYSSWGLVTGTGQNVSNVVYYAGGGGSGLGSSSGGTAGTGGFGGGGAGVKGSPYTATTGTANTGGGGGGSGGGGAPGSAGGSGLVIVRYAK